MKIVMTLNRIAYQYGSNELRCILGNWERTSILFLDFSANFRANISRTEQDTDNPGAQLESYASLLSF